MRSLLRICAALSICAIGLPALCQEGERADTWMDTAWSHRLLLLVPAEEERAGVNTARFELGDLGDICREDGADLRVTTRGGAEVPCAVERDDDGSLAVRFRVSGASTEFYLYCGNPGAAAQPGSWKEETGGLRLTVRPTAGRVFAFAGRGRNPASTRDTVVARIMAEVSRDRKPYASQEWGQINDLENPFRPDAHPFVRGADPGDYYISIYEGTILAPMEGDYDFGINADDAAVFGMEIKGRLEWLCWRGMSGISMEWDDPENPNSVLRQEDRPYRRRKLHLKWGLHKIAYYHVENDGGQLAALGWQTPDMEEIDVVPVRAFTRYLPVRLMGREVQGQPFSPFFRVQHRFNLRINDGEDVFPNYTLELVNGWGGRKALAGLSVDWTLPSGDRASGSVVSGEFAGRGPFTVAADIASSDDAKVIVKRTFSAPEEPVHAMLLKLQIQTDSVLLRGKGGGDVEVLVAARNGAPRTLQLRTVSRPLDGRSETVSPARPVKVTPVSGGADDEWTSVVAEWDPGAASSELEAQLLLHGRVVAATRLAVVSAADDLEGVTLDESQDLRSPDGALLNLIAPGLVRDDVAARVPVDGRGNVRILVLDELLAGAPGQAIGPSYAGLLRELLQKRYPTLKFEVERVAVQGEVGTRPITKFLGVVRALDERDPTVVLLVWPPQAIVDGLPVEQYEAYLSATVDNILQRTTAELFLVNTPPMPLQPDVARPYAAAVKKVALRKEVRAIDVYSRFLLLDDWEGLFRSAQRRYPSFTLYPSRTGQEEVAREAYAAMVDALHQAFSTAERKLSVQRSAAGEQ